eukprot:3856159-Prymnesium_polylepis.1
MKDGVLAGGETLREVRVEDARCATRRCGDEALGRPGWPAAAGIGRLARDDLSIYGWPLWCAVWR